MVMSANEIAQMNKMNKASQTPALGTIVAGLQTAIGASGSHLVVASESNGSSLSIDTGLGSVTGILVNVSRAGSALSSDPYLSKASGSLTVEPGSSYAVTTDDVIYWMAF